MAMPKLANVESLPGFHWTTPVVEHVGFHSFVMDPPRHLDADDFDPFFEDELPSYEEVRDGDRR